MIFRVVASMLLSTIISGCGFCVVYSSECYFSSFENIDQAREKNAFTKGWLPHWLPESAVEIHEGHDLDTNAQAISFSLSGNAHFSLPTTCQSVSSAPRPRLKTSKFPRRIHKSKNIQICEDLYLVVDRPHRVHLWKN